MMASGNVKVNALNEHLLCVLCGGYLIDATTIIECLHSFCRSCIFQYLEASSFCPTCDTEVHSSKPLLGVLPDYTLQAIVYKLVPGLLTREINRRVEFYSKNALTFEHNAPYPPVSTHRHSVTMYDELRDTIYREMTRGELFYTEDERISLCLEYYIGNSPNRFTKARHIRRDKNNNYNEVVTSRPLDKRYLLCPATVTVNVLKKFITNKFDLPSVYQIDIIHTKEVLKDSFKLLDIAYIYTWRRSAPLRLYYTVYERRPVVSVPVHIPLPSQLRKRCLTCRSGSHAGRALKAPPGLMPAASARRPEAAFWNRDEDSKVGIADEIRKFASRRSRAFKMRARADVRCHGSSLATGHCRYHALTSRGPAPINVKQEVASDEGEVAKSVLPPVGSFRVRIPRYVINGHPVIVKRRRSTSSSSYMTSTGSESPERSNQMTGLRHYDFDDDVDSRPTIPKIFRRRLSDSSWSSDL